MFAAVDPSRPWEPTGMTTGRWMRLPARPVPLHDLVATQDGIYLAPLLRQEPSSHSGDPLPHVVAYGGRLYLSDGHHRAMRAALNGQQRIDARILVMDGRR